MSRTPTQAIIFDMDGTMIDSMPWHAQAWVEFARRRRMDVDVPDLMARTTGRNGTECIRELLGREVPQVPIPWGCGGKPYFDLVAVAEGARG